MNGMVSEPEKSLNERLEDKLKEMGVELSDVSRCLLDKNPLEIVNAGGKGIYLAQVREGLMIKNILEKGYGIISVGKVTDEERYKFALRALYNKKGVYVIFSDELRGTREINTPLEYFVFISSESIRDFSQRFLPEG